MKSRTAYILLGGNMGNRMQYLQSAVNLLKNNVGKIKNISSIWESEPWGFEASTSFYNCVLEIETIFKPNELLEKILETEKIAGRERKDNSEGYSSRPIDIDILYYGDEIVSTPNLEIPHPRLHLRRFTLNPLAEIAADFIHPILKKSTLQLLNSCPNKAIPNQIKEQLIF